MLEKISHPTLEKFDIKSVISAMETLGFEHKDNLFKRNNVALKIYSDDWITRQYESETFVFIRMIYNDYKPETTENVRDCFDKNIIRLVCNHSTGEVFLTGNFEILKLFTDLKIIEFDGIDNVYKSFRIGGYTIPVKIRES
jgi:hypothetical protein